MAEASGIGGRFRASESISISMPVPIPRSISPLREPFEGNLGFLSHDVEAVGFGRCEGF